MTEPTDDHRNVVRKLTLAEIDGTFHGPEAIAEITAMHLHRLGAAKAASVTFVADGAPWIWDRIPEIVRRAGLTNAGILGCKKCERTTSSMAVGNGPGNRYAMARVLNAPRT